MFLYICLQIVYYYTLLYIRTFFWFRSCCSPWFRGGGVLSLVPGVVSSMVPGVLSFRVPGVLSFMVPGVLSFRVPGVLSFRVPVVISSRVPRRHICSHQPCGDASREYSAAGSLASELKVSGLFSKCDCSKYQLFVCPF